MNMVEACTKAVADPGEAGGPWPPRWRPENFFCQYINIITKPTAYDGPW